MTDRELNKVVADHLPLAQKAARHYAEKYYLEEDDVYELALEDLARAAQSWNPDRGVTFGMYALRFMGYILNNQCKRLYRKTYLSGEVSFNTTGADLKGVSAEGKSSGLGVTAFSDMEAILPCKEPDCYQRHARQQAWNVIAAMLDKRQFMVLAYHYGLEPLPKLTLQEIGDRLHVTKERVRQIEVQALDKIRKAYQSTGKGRKALHALREYVVAKSA